MNRDESAFVWLRPRLSLLGTAGVVGVFVGGLGLISLAVFGSVHAASTRVFALGALVFGFGLLGWSGSALAGRGIATMQHRLDVATDWTERDSRRAMARLCGFGAGVMVGVVVVTSVVAPFLP